MLNENLVATLITLLAVAMLAFGLDDGSLVKMIVAAWLGWLGKSKYDQNKGGDSN